MQLLVLFYINIINNNFLIQSLKYKQISFKNSLCHCFIKYIYLNNFYILFI